MWQIGWVSLLAGMSTPLGAFVVLRFKRLSKGVLALFLGLAAGIMITVILTELMPTSIMTGGHQLFLEGAASGFVLMWIVRQITSRIVQHSTLHKEHAAFLQIGWFIALAIALHDLPEGLAIGAGDAVRPEIGLIIAMAIALHNIPEGMSIAAPLRLAGVKRRFVALITVLVGFVTPIGTVLSLWLFQVSTLFIALSLAFAAGAMMYVVARDILPESMTADRKNATVGTLVGAVAMTAMSMLTHGAA